VQLQQVIVNLLVNSFQAIAQSDASIRNIFLGTSCEAEGAVCVSIRDTGPGISEDNFDRVFDSFFSTKKGGIGIGLAICKSIVTAHGGDIRPRTTRTAVHCSNSLFRSRRCKLRIHDGFAAFAGKTKCKAPRGISGSFRALRQAATQPAMGDVLVVRLRRVSRRWRRWGNGGTSHQRGLDLRQR
jgi:signal transduction histidine kinase